MKNDWTSILNFVKSWSVHILLQLLSGMGDISLVFESVGENGAIYISGVNAAADLCSLRSKNIRAVLTVASRGLRNYKPEEIPYYLYLPAEDVEDFNITALFDQSYEFIDQARRRCNVLVHCMAGISRSATISIAYLVRKYGYSVKTVLSMLQRRRTQIMPNAGFMKQLLEFEGKCTQVSLKRELKRRVNSAQNIMSIIASIEKEKYCLASDNQEMAHQKQPEVKRLIVRRKTQSKGHRNEQRKIVGFNLSLVEPQNIYSQGIYQERRLDHRRTSSNVSVLERQNQNSVMQQLLQKKMLKMQSCEIMTEMNRQNGRMRLLKREK